MNDEYSDFEPQQEQQEPEKLSAIEVLSNIQSRLKAPKGQVNKFGNYKYRSCEDIVEAVKPLLAEHSAALFITDEPVMVGDWHYIHAVATVSANGHTISVSGYAREAETKKGMDVSQITGASSSYARKYALNGLFAIDDTKDADTKDNTDHKEIAAQQAKTNVNGTHIDVRKLNAVVDECVLIVDECDDDEESGPKRAREIYEPLTDDERIYVNGELGKRKFTNPATGRDVQYWKPFKVHLLHAS
jgi:hypothetical protein